MCLQLFNFRFSMHRSWFHSCEQNFDIQSSTYYMSIFNDILMFEINFRPRREYFRLKPKTFFVGCRSNVTRPGLAIKGIRATKSLLLFNSQSGPERNSSTQVPVIDKTFLYSLKLFLKNRTFRGYSLSKFCLIVWLWLCICSSFDIWLRIPVPSLWSSF